MNDANITTETAIVITKKISTKKSDQQAIHDLFLLRFGIFNNDDKKTKKYYIEFMTEKGKISFLVSSEFYHHTKIDSLGSLKHDNNKIIEFNFYKIANKQDVTKLNW